MADATSVGTIELDIEVTEGSISREMGKLDKAFNSSDLTAGFKDTLDGFTKNLNNFVKNNIAKLTDSIKDSMNELSGMKNTPKVDTKTTENKFLNMFRRMNVFAKDSMSKLTGNIREFGQVGTESNQKVSQSVQRLNNQYETTQNKISEIRNEIAKLDAQRDAIAASYQDMPAFSGMTKEESIDDMVRGNEEYQRLGAEIAELEAKITPLSNKNRDLAASIKQVSDETSKASKETSKANIETSKMGSYAKKAIQSMFGLTWVKKLFSRESKNANNATSAFNNSLQRMSRTVARNLIVYGLIIRGIRSMIGYMWSALKTNDQFAHSLNVIRTNLLVAFQPIYEFVLPALNALMSAIATVTTYIASAISALFGKTYKQSFRAAKSMNTAIKSMGGVGKATKGVGKAAKKTGKEVKGALAGFDEINKLDIPKDDGGSGGAPGAGGGGGAGGFEMAMPDLATIDMSGIEKFKEIMASIFEPFKLAWENEGQATIDAMKYALTSIWGLTKEIGKSWLEVWTNGTGQAILETILRIIQNILGRIGDMARSFTRAWVEGGRGTAIMQHLHNVILHVLTLVEKLTETNRRLWGEYGDTLARIFLETLKNILGVFDHLGQKLVWVWDNGGRHLYEGISRLLAKIIELAGYIINEFIIPFAHGFIEIAAPAVAGLMDSIGYLLDIFTHLIDWLLGDGKPVLDIIVNVLGSMAVAFGLVKGAVAIYNGIMIIATGITSAFGAVMTFITSPIGIVTLAIAGIIAGLKLFGVTLDDVKNLVSKFVNAIVGFFKWLYDVLVGNSIVPDMVEGIIGCFGDMFKKVIDTVKRLVERVKSFFTNLRDSAQRIWDRISSFMIEPIKRARERVSTLVSNLRKNVIDRWGQIRSGISGLRSRLVNAMLAPFKAARSQISNIVKSAKNWGRNLIGNFIDGINAMIGKVRNAVKKVADIPKKLLGFSSPTEEGPGKDADKWMPNFMGMLADGIEDNIHEVSAAVNMTAGTLQGIQPDNTDSIASAVSSAISGSIQTLGGEGNGDTTFIVKIGEDTITEKIVSDINRKNRASGETIIEI